MSSKSEHQNVVFCAESVFFLVKSRFLGVKSRSGSQNRNAGVECGIKLGNVS